MVKAAVLQRLAEIRGERHTSQNSFANYITMFLQEPAPHDAKRLMEIKQLMQGYE